MDKGLSGNATEVYLSSCDHFIPDSEFEGSMITTSVKPVG